MIPRSLATWQRNREEPPPCASDGACTECSTEGYADHDGDSGYWVAPEPCEICGEPVCDTCERGHVEGHLLAVEETEAGEAAWRAWEAREGRRVTGDDTHQALTAVMRGALRVAGEGVV